MKGQLDTSPGLCRIVPNLLTCAHFFIALEAIRLHDSTAIGVLFSLVELNWHTSLYRSHLRIPSWVAGQPTESGSLTRDGAVARGRY